MRNFYLLFAFLLFVQTRSYSQNFIPFQGIALDGVGKVISGQKISLRLSILKDNANGAISYAESHNTTTDKNGLFQINIGTGNTLTNNFSSIDWSTLNYFLKVEMDIYGGSNYLLISNTKIGSVPFALYSNSSKKPPVYQAIGNTSDTLQIEDNVDIVETTDGNWKLAFKLPKPTQANSLLSQRKNTSILINCKSTFSISILNTNSNLRDNLILNTGEFAIFLFDGEKWLNTGGKSIITDTKNNIHIGSNSLENLTSGYQNLAIGSFALSKNTTGAFNVGVGNNVLENTTSGSWNTAIGVQALRNNSIGIANVSVGQGSLYSNSISSQNVAVGREALYQSLTSNNVAVGDRTMFNNSTGTSNTAIGAIAGLNNKSGSNNLFLGYDSQSSTENASNEINLGNANIRTIRSAVTSLTSLSDARDKKNIQDLSLGLNFIQTLKPRSFQWDKRDWYAGNSSDGSRMAKTATAGFIAQELDESQQKFNADWLNLVYKSNPEKLEANYGNLIPILVKSIQELLEEQTKLLKRIEQLESKLK